MKINPLTPYFSDLEKFGIHQNSWEHWVLYLYHHLHVIQTTGDPPLSHMVILGILLLKPGIYELMENIKLFLS